jgi:hypothetical protein
MGTRVHWKCLAMVELTWVPWFVSVGCTNTSRVLARSGGWLDGREILRTTSLRHGLRVWLIWRAWGGGFWSCMLKIFYWGSGELWLPETQGLDYEGQPFCWCSVRSLNLIDLIAFRGSMGSHSIHTLGSCGSAPCVHPDYRVAACGLVR